MSNRTQTSREEQPDSNDQEGSPKQLIIVDSSPESSNEKSTANPLTPSKDRKFIPGSPEKPIVIDPSTESSDEKNTAKPATPQKKRSASSSLGSHDIRAPNSLRFRQGLGDSKQPELGSPPKKQRVNQGHTQNVVDYSYKGPLLAHHKDSVYLIIGLRDQIPGASSEYLTHYQLFNGHWSMLVYEGRDNPQQCKKEEIPRAALFDYVQKSYSENQEMEPTLWNDAKNLRLAFDVAVEGCGRADVPRSEPPEDHVSNNAHASLKEQRNKYPPKHYRKKFGVPGVWEEYEP